MNTLITPHNPVGSSPDDDETGVRALLSGLPEPDPMPAHLVERISASLAAEQAQRGVISRTSVTPLLATTRRRPGRLLVAIAGAAAAAALIGVVANNLLTASRSSSTSASAAADITSDSREASPAAPQGGKTKPSAGGDLSPASIQIRLSEIHYTQADFVTQVRTLRDATFDSTQPMADKSVGAGPVGTTGGLTDCLSAIGASGAQRVRADLAFYEGRPAVIIVATTDGIPTAYVVGRECSRTNAALLRPATALP